MKTIVFAQQKGGAGKTSLCAHLAVAAELTRTPAVLFDTDPQQSLGDWWREREGDTPALSACTLEQFPERLAALKETGEYKVALVDTPGMASPTVAALIALADLVLVPVRPSPHDLRALGPTVSMLQEAGTPFRFVLNGINPRGRLTAQAVAALSAYGPVSPVFIAARTDLVSSMTDGRTALETSPGSPAAAEIRNLWTYVRNELKKGK